VVDWHVIHIEDNAAVEIECQCTRIQHRNMCRVAEEVVVEIEHDAAAIIGCGGTREIRGGNGQ